MRAVQTLMLSVTLAAAAGCVEMNTTGRRLILLPENQDSMAIDLDAQRRLILYGAKKYCAEPSPDALQAYAASLGLGASIPGQGAGSLSVAQQNTAASIGLRTQSITIMRDALYRMCEAYNNDKLGDIMVATLLHRSQDLTAVILAVEQLTGAVAANQVILTDSAEANASARLVANEQALDAARRNEEKRKQNVKEATQARDDAKADLNSKKTAEELAIDERKVAEGENPKNQAKINKAEAKERRATEAREEAEDALEEAEQDLRTAAARMESAEEVRETLEASMDFALTNTAAATGGAGRFGVVAPTKQLSAEATKEIATAVKEMVTTVVNKSYAVESCMALLTSTGPDDEIRRGPFLKLFALCADLVSEGISKELKNVTTYAPDDNTKIIEEAIENDPALRQKLNKWLQDQGFLIRVTTLLKGDYAALRARAVKEVIFGNCIGKPDDQ